MNPAQLPSLSRMVSRALRRKCPRCGEPAYQTFFGMRQHCRRCGLEFEREEGYWVGAMIFNTTVTFATFLLVFGGSIVLTWPDVPWPAVLAITILANVLVPVWFYPVSKTLWMAFDLSWHPLEEEEVTAASARAGDEAFRVS